MATWNEFVDRYGTNAHRQQLLKRLRLAFLQLRSAGCTTGFVDGSFVTTKELPSDVDVAWNASGVDADALDPAFLKLQDRTEMKNKYGGDYFPAKVVEAGSMKAFLDFFQTDKATGNKKGIVQINLGTVS